MSEVLHSPQDWTTFPKDITPICAETDNFVYGIQLVSLKILAAVFDRTALQISSFPVAPKFRNTIYK